MNNYLDKLANVLINYSLELKPNKLLKIDAEPESLPLIKAVYKEAISVGANVYVDLKVGELEEVFYKNANDDQLSFLNPIDDYKYDKIDYMLTIWGTNNIKHLSGIDPSKQQKYFRTIKPMREKMFARMDDKSLIWCGTQYPTPAVAQNAGLSTADYEEFIFRAGHLHEDDPSVHWKNVEKEQNRLVEILNQSHIIRIHAENTDLEMNVEGRTWVNCCGHLNFPDGELFTSPVEDSVSGTISFTYPANYKGRDVEGVRLTFESGKVVKATAESDEEFLIAMLDTDEGARRVGEFAIGTNYEISRFTRNTLFDEKIGGTCHLAVGNGIGESGGVNKSSIHWDMVCDLKTGEIEADGQAIYRNGRFVI